MSVLSLQLLRTLSYNNLMIHESFVNFSQFEYKSCSISFSKTQQHLAAVIPSQSNGITSSSKSSTFGIQKLSFNISCLSTLYSIRLLAFVFVSQNYRTGMLLHETSNSAFLLYGNSSHISALLLYLLFFNKYCYIFYTNINFVTLTHYQKHSLKSYVLHAQFNIIQLLPISTISKHISVKPN